MWTIAQLAGYIEGEGSFLLNKKYDPSIKIQVTDGDVLANAALVMGGRLSGPHGPHGVGKKPTYSLYLRGLLAIQLMLTLYPHMGQRRQAKIRSVLDGWEHRPIRVRPMQGYGRCGRLTKSNASGQNVR